MKKNIFWIGIIILVVGLILFFLAGATGSGNEALVPLIYQTNQAYWLALTLAGFIVLVAGLMIKSKKSTKSVKLKKKK